MFCTSDTSDTWVIPFDIDVFWSFLFGFLAATAIFLFYVIPYIIASVESNTVCDYYDEKTG